MNIYFPPEFLPARTTTLIHVMEEGKMKQYKTIDGILCVWDIHENAWVPETYWDYMEAERLRNSTMEGTK